jgi:hypothetical protein
MQLQQVKKLKIPSFQKMLICIIMTTDMSNKMSTQSLAEMYYERDVSMNLNPNQSIYLSLKKLRYIEIDEKKDENDFKVFLFKKYLKDYNKLDEYKDAVDNSDELVKYRENRKLSKERGNFLSKFLNSDDNKRFYESLTDDELEYIGY